VKKTTKQPISKDHVNASDPVVDKRGFGATKGMIMIFEGVMIFEGMISSKPIKGCST
jgi:hypothetical protein